MPFVRANDLTVAYELSGPPDAPSTLVLANALGTTMHMWDDLVAPLASHRRVLRYDLRGHGGTSDGNPQRVGIDVLADDVVALLDALRISHAAVAGASIGGMVAQSVAARRPSRIAAVVLIATGNRIGVPATWDERIATVESSGMSAITEPLLERWFAPRTRAERPELIDGFRTMLHRASPAGYIAGCRAVRDADLRPDDAAIRCPALIISGEGDPVTPPASGSAMHDAIAGSRMCVIDGAAHLVAVERPDETAGAIEEFIDELGAPGNADAAREATG